MDGIIHDSRPGFSILPTRSEVPSCCGPWPMGLPAVCLIGPWSVFGEWHVLAHSATSGPSGPSRLKQAG